MTRGRVAFLCLFVACGIDSAPVEPTPRCEDLACVAVECDGGTCECQLPAHGGSHLTRYETCTEE